MGKYRPIVSAITELLLLSLCIISFILNWLSYYRVSRKYTKRKSASTPQVTLRLEKVSVIIAIKNEARHIGKTLRNLESTTVNKTKVEIILVDCGGKDNSIDVAKASSGALSLKVVKVSNAQGRGSAFNSGADVAGGDILLFLRADSLVPPGYDETLRRELSSPDVYMTAFKFGLHSTRASSPTGSPSVAPPRDQPAPLSATALSCVIMYQNMLSTMCKLPRGSQGLAMSVAFARANKFPSDILLEDVCYVQEVRRTLLQTGQVQKGLKILEQSVLSSAEEAVSVGILKHTFINILAFSLRYHFGVSDEGIYRWCYVRMPKFLQHLKV